MRCANNDTTAVTSVYQNDINVLLTIVTFDRKSLYKSSEVLIRKNMLLKILTLMYQNLEDFMRNLTLLYTEI